MLRRALWAALLPIGCGPSYGVTETTFTVHQAAVLAAPSAPRAAGPPVARGRVAMEGSFAYDANNAGPATRLQGGGAHFALNTRGSLLTLFNVGDLIELGPSFEWSFGGLTPAATDLEPRSGFAFGRGGLVMRVPFVRNRPWILGANVELLLMGASLARRIDRDDLRTSYTRCVGPFDCMRTETPQGTTRTGSTSSSDRASLWATMRLGLYGGGRLGSRVTLLGGMSVQTQPEIVGYQVTTSVCDTRDSGHSGSCDDPPITASLTRFVGTPWISVGVDLGRVTLFAQGHVNAIGPSAIVDRSRGGASLTTRVNF